MGPVAFTPKGGCPLKPPNSLVVLEDLSGVAFTPKGGCPLKHAVHLVYTRHTLIDTRSIHPQGWVPIETLPTRDGTIGVYQCSIHLQGWVPIETVPYSPAEIQVCRAVAFTPKGGCLLKPPARRLLYPHISLVAFTPKGGCPLKPTW